MKYPAYVYAVYLGTKPYIGISHNPDKRFAAHRAHLQAGTHPVEDFQADYDASANKELHLLRLEEVASESERWKEHKWQYYFRSYEREHGYNYKDPTARTEVEKAERKEHVKTYLKDRMRNAFLLVAKKPPRSRKQALRDFLEETKDLSTEEFLAQYC